MAWFRICRSVRTRAGIALRDVPHPINRTDSFSLCAPDADKALENARAVVADTRGLVAVSEEN